MPAVAGSSEDLADPAGLIARDSAPLPRRLGRSSTDPSPVPSLFSGSDWADRNPLEDAVAEAAPAPTAPGTGQDTGPDADDGGLRRRSGLMMPADVATPLQDARSGGASVTETESARSEAGEVTVSGSTAGSTAGLLAAAAVTRVDQPLAGSDDVAASVLDGQPAILRLPFDAPRLLWPLEEVAELLSRGLASRLDNVTSRRADRRGLFNPTPERLDAPRGLAVALIGPLGVGKTTIALAHAHQQLPRLDILWWARGGSEAELRTDLLALAAAVGLDTSGTIDPLSGLRRWLERCQEGWLLIIDELDPSVPVGSMLPRSGRGQIVVTTTAELEGMDTVPVRPPSAAAAHRALQHAATLGTAGGNPETAPAGDQPRDSSLDVLGARLAGQPWALTMAARLLADQVGAATLAGALSNPPHQPLLAGTADGAADAQLLSTLDQLSQRFSEAVPTMLALTALGGTVAAISLADLVDVVDLVGPAGEPSTDQTIGAFLADAARWSLVVTGEDGLMVVPAVAAALQRLQTAEAAAAALTAAAAVGTLPAPATAETVLVDEHADEYADELVEELVEEPVEDAAVETFEMIAHPDGAEPQLIDALSVPAGSLGDFPSQAPEETDSTEPDAEAARLEELRDRGLAAVADGDHFAAALRLEELVVRCDAAFGSSDVRSLSARSDLAAALTAGGSHHRAHQLLAQVLEETRTANGEQHPATFAAMHNLANSHADLGRHREALSLRQAVFDGRRSTLGETHPQTVAALANLANSLALLGRAEEALQARQRVADVRESTLGTDHAHTLGALNNLANSYAEVGRHGDALELRQRVLASRERQLGPDHQHTITARNNLANSLMALGRVAEALSERERTLLDCERVLGVDHPLTITARANVTFGAPTPPSAAPTPGSGPTPFLLPPPNPAVPAPAGPEQDPEPAHSAEQPFGTGFHGPPDSPPAMPIGFDPPAAGPPMQHAAVSSPNWAPPAGSIPNGTPLGGSGVPWPPPASTAPSMADAAPNAWVEPPPRKRRFWFFLFRR
ncbi:MAG: tetratricopeptide repeat protein [Acidimicrobiales bacterium]